METPSEKSKAYLEIAVNKIRALIHKSPPEETGDADKQECDSDMDYCFFVFYCGHGRCEGKEYKKDDGSWGTTTDSLIELDAIKECLSMIGKCSSGCKGVGM